MAVPIAADPLITQLRRQITETDRAIVELVNQRLGLVTTMKGYKARRGIEFFDAEREDWMLTYLHRANGGPLSAAGLAELFGELLALTKREVIRLERAER
ncbi:MAG: chorismate mutase [Gaiellaceae bacterium]